MNVSSASQATTIVLARHGQTYANVTGERIQGGNSDQPEHQLTELGRTQAKELGQRLKECGYKVDAFYSSTLGRARETCGIVKEFSFEEHDGSVQVNPNFDEIRHGPHDGMKTEEMNRIFQECIASNDDLYNNTPFVGAETQRKVTERMLEGMEQVAEANLGKTALVVGHGGSSRALHTWCTAREKKEEIPKHYTTIPSIKNGEFYVYHWQPKSEELQGGLKFIKVEVLNLHS
jgi:broad specificity phosphatase PhoE